MKKLIFSLLATLSTAFAAESQVDLRIDTNPRDLNAKSSLNVSTTTAVYVEESHAILMMPEMSFYTNGGIDFSVTGAHRHRWNNWVWGHTMFFDRTYVDGNSLDQIGTGMDLQTDRFDFRANYYHPATHYGNAEFVASKWLDAEIFFKTKYFGVGTGPLYNIDMKAWALHSRIVIPLRNCSLNFGGICGSGELGQSQAVFSISFHLFKPSKANRLISPPCHVQKSNIYYNSAYSFEGKDDTQVVLQYNPNLVSYIEQTEDEATLGDKEGE
jgi:hypothetical protein